MSTIRTSRHYPIVLTLDHDDSAYVEFCPDGVDAGEDSEKLCISITLLCLPNGRRAMAVTFPEVSTYVLQDEAKALSLVVLEDKNRPQDLTIAPWVLKRWEAK